MAESDVHVHDQVCLVLLALACASSLLQMRMKEVALEFHLQQCHVAMHQ